MNKVRVVVLVTACAIGGPATQAQQYNWGRDFGSTDHDIVNDVQASGNRVHVVGSFRGTISIGATTLTAPSSSRDAIIIAYDTLGAVVWANNSNTAFDEDGWFVVPFQNGAVVMVSQYQTPFCGHAYKLRCYSSNGTLLWTKDIGGMNLSQVVGGQNNDIVLCSWSSGGGVCLPSFGDTTLQAASASQMIVASISASGATNWVQAFDAVAGGAIHENSRAVLVDSMGIVYCATDFLYGVTVGDTTIYSAGGFLDRDQLLVCLDSSGMISWVWSDNEIGYSYTQWQGLTSSSEGLCLLRFGYDEPSETNSLTVRNFNSVGSLSSSNTISANAIFAPLAAYKDLVPRLEGGYYALRVVGSLSYGDHYVASGFFSGFFTLLGNVHRLVLLDSTFHEICEWSIPQAKALAISGQAVVVAGGFKGTRTFGADVLVSFPTDVYDAFVARADGIPVPQFIGLPDTVLVSGGQIALVAFPSGGQFFGAGVQGSVFDPISVGAGTFQISYVVNYFGCSLEVSESVVVEIGTGLSTTGERGEMAHVQIGGVGGLYALPQGTNRVELLDFAGRLLRSQQFASGEVIIRFEDVPHGLYMLQFCGPNRVAARVVSVRE